jgi:hypothetical protein
LKTFNGALRPKDHSVTLACKMEYIRPPCAKLDKTIQHSFGLSDFEPGTERAAAINQCHDILRVFTDRFIEALKGLVKAILLPERAGPSQFGNIRAKTWNDGRSICGHALF